MAGKVAAAIDPAPPAAPAATYAIDAAGNPVQVTNANQAYNIKATGGKVITQGEAEGLSRGQANNQWADERLGTVGNALVGGASGLTLGLSDYALTGTGAMTPGQLNASRTTFSNKVGDVIGTLAPAILSGGDSLLAKGAMATPMGLVGRAGAAAEGGVSRLMKTFAMEGALGEAAGPILKLAARGATEGALMNAAHTTTEALTQNKPLSAEALVSSFGDGFLTGGAMGAGLGAIGAAFGGAKKLIGSGTMTGEAAEAQSLRTLSHYGADAETLASAKEYPGGAREYLKKQYGMLEAEGVSLKSSPGTIAKAAQEQVTKSEMTIKDTLDALSKEAPQAVPSGIRAAGQFKQEIMEAYAGLPELNNAAKFADRVTEELSGPKGTMKVGGPRTWEQWDATRNTYANKLAAAADGSFEQSAYQRLLGIVDKTMESEMKLAAPELQAKYAAATTDLRMAKSLKEMSGNYELKQALKKNPLEITPQDGGTLGFAVLTGANPIVGLGMAAARKLGLLAADKLEPAMADYMARKAIGVQAGAAAAQSSQRLAASMNSFITGARAMSAEKNARAEFAPAPAPRPKVTMKSYENSVKFATDFTSPARLAQVNRGLDGIRQQGHPELADAISTVRQRAADYIGNNIPKDTMQMSVGKSPTMYAPTMQAIKFISQLSAIQDPVGTMERGLKNNDLSRSEVAAIKYVYPEIHGMLVQHAAQSMIQAKAQGKFVPADKLATLGIALDAPVDNKLSKEFIGAVQSSFAPPQQPEAPGGNAPTADTSSFQTPLQSMP